jgi:hypothetical protein
MSICSGSLSQPAILDSQGRAKTAQRNAALLTARRRVPISVHPQRKIGAQ